MKNYVSAAVLALTALSVTPAAQAHEFRDLGNGYGVWVGSYNEPAYAGVVNGVDIYPQYEYKDINGKTQYYLVNQEGGDTVEFTVSEILYSDKPLPVIHAKQDIPTGTLVVNTLVPHGPVPPSPIEQKFGTGDLQYHQYGPQYNNHFMPVNPGYYGFHIAGRMRIKFSNIKPGKDGLNTQGVPGTNVVPPAVVFNEYFICGAGSQDKPNTSFGCYDQILGIAGIGQAKAAPAK